MLAHREWGTHSRQATACHQWYQQLLVREELLGPRNLPLFVCQETFALHRAHWQEHHFRLHVLYSQTCLDQLRQPLQRVPCKDIFHLLNHHHIGQQLLTGSQLLPILNSRT